MHRVFHCRLWLVHNGAIQPGSLHLDAGEGVAGERSAGEMSADTNQLSFMCRVDGGRVCIVDFFFAKILNGKA